MGAETGPPLSESIRRQLGDPVLIRRLASSPRSEVFLVEFGGAPTIVKHITSGPGCERRYQVEVAALRLAGRVQPSPVAGLLATDSAARVLVLEYLEGGRPATQAWAVQYATALARLHNAPVAEHDTDIPRHRGPGNDDVRAFVQIARQLGVFVPSSPETELIAALDRLANSDDEVLLHGDPCPDNAVPTGDGVRFVDLEGAQRGPAALELAYLRIGFPTCWCVKALPGRHITAAENAYRDARRSRSSARPDDLADACVSWLLHGDALVERARRRGRDHLAQLQSRDWAWGTATARERLLHRLSVVAELADSHDRLTATAGLARDMEAAIKERWPRLSAIPRARDSPMDDEARL